MATLKRLFLKARANSGTLKPDSSEDTNAMKQTSDECAKLRKEELLQKGIVMMDLVDEDDNLPIPRISVTFGPIETTVPTTFKSQTPKPLTEEDSTNDNAVVSVNRRSSLKKNGKGHRRGYSLNSSSVKELTSDTSSPKTVKLKSDDFKLTYNFDIPGESLNRKGSGSGDSNAKLQESNKKAL